MQIRTWGLSGLCAQGRQPTPGRFNILWEDKAPQIVKGRQGVRQKWLQSHRLQGPEVLDGVQSVEKQVRPHRILPPEAAGITSSHGQSPAGRHRGLSERLQGEVDPWEPRLGPTPGPHRPLIRGGVPPQDPANTTQGRAPPWDPTDHCSRGAHPGTPQTTAQGRAPPHPVLLELLQLRVLIGTSETVR